jgi:lipid-binding SYLF domain-containing protein
MKQHLTKVTLAIGVLALAVGIPVRADEADVAKRLANATETLREFATPNQAAVSEARCIGVVPNLTEAALLAGAKHGEGVITCKDAQGRWNAPAFISITGGTFGAQAGVERKDLVMLVMTEEGKQKFYDAEFDLGAAAEATAGDRSARADWQGRNIVVYTSARGAFAGANVSGTVVKQDNDAMTTIYGENAQTRSVLQGQVRRPAIAEDFLKQVEQMQPPARAAR